MAEHTTRERIEAVERLRAEAVNAGSPRAVERQHARGKLLARERIELLLDPGSFTELDAFVQHRSPNFNMMENRPYGDGVVTGHGTIEGRRVFVFSQDFTVFGGSLGEAFAEKSSRSWTWRSGTAAPSSGSTTPGAPASRRASSRSPATRTSSSATSRRPA
jgi:propionyl-CoA carboxylase beta chain